MMSKQIEKVEGGVFKAWSQNLGHEGVLTTFYSDGDVPDYRQSELLRKLAEPSTLVPADMEAMIQQTMLKMMNK